MQFATVENNRLVTFIWRLTSHMTRKLLAYHLGKAVVLTRNIVWETLRPERAPVIGLHTAGIAAFGAKQQSSKLTFVQ